jgi:tetratricopeptide (TPR) repeat protein
LGEPDRILAYLCEAETVAEALGDHRRLGWVLARMSQICTLAGEYDQGLVLAQRALTLATSSGDRALEGTANWYLGGVFYYLSDYRQAIDFLSRAVLLLEGELRHTRLGQGLTSILSRAYLGQCLAEVGAFAEGLVWGEEGLHIAEAVNHAFSLSIVCQGVGYLYLRQGDLHHAIPFLERGFSLTRVADISSIAPWIASTLGMAYALARRNTEALALLEQAVEQATAIRRLAYHTPAVTHLSEAYLLTGRLDEARQLAQRALDRARTHQERGHEAWILRLLGDIAAQSAPPDGMQAADHYHQALTLAEELGMRPLQAHCHCGLGTLYARTGQREQARAALCAAIDLYRAMDMVFWLPQTEAVLAQVEG